MFKSALVVAFFFTVFQFCESAKRCRRAIGRCNVNGTMTNYNTCTKLCCGKQLFDREPFGKCCGNQNFGTMYYTDIETCCSWPPAGEYGIHNKTDGEEEPKCCGAALFDFPDNPHIQCCSSWNTKPQPFNTLDSMCCQGRVGYIRTTAYADCCYDVAYDRRFSSCPCYNGKLVKAKRWESACCKAGDDQDVWEPYIKATQGCCDGNVYDLATQICCNGAVGNATTDYCCNGILTEQSVENSGNVNIGCCTVGGDEVIFNAEFQTCCGGLLVDRVTEGDSCCAGDPYFEESGNCCNNTVFDIESAGDACCNDSPYKTSNGVCCGGSVVGNDLVWPACCVFQSFDAYTHTCCGSTVYPNPPDGKGETSHHTRCCGDFGDPSTLYPYDYDIETCCNGVNVSLFRENGDKIGNAQCCGSGAMDGENDLCCDDVVNENPYGEFGRCEGNFTYDIRQVIYCEGIRIEHEFGADAICCGIEAFDGKDSICCDGVRREKTSENSECCGGEAMNSDAFKCCNGVPQPLNGIPKDKAVCCGDGCIDGSRYWCCEGKAYWKGENNEFGDLVTGGLSCSDFFKADVKPRRKFVRPAVFSGFLSPTPPKKTTTTTVATTTLPTTTTTEATEPTTEPPPAPRRGRGGRGRGARRRPG